jgi:hypothetical protein
MWISREHFNLIRERAAEFRGWHEDRMREKDAIIQHQEARLASLEQERRELTQAILTNRPPVYALETVHPPPENEMPSGDWMRIMEEQVKDLEKPDEPGRS